MEDPSKVFFTSDLHLGHRNIIKYSNRPFATLEDMHVALRDRWNGVVPRDGVVYFLGDVALGLRRAELAAYLDSLHGTIHLITGNHDDALLRDAVSMKRFASVGKLHEVKVPDQDANRGIQRITLCHYAMDVWNQSHHGAWQLYGHSHGTRPDPKTAKKMDIGTDTNNFTPWSYYGVKARMSFKTFVPVDGHGEER